MKRLSFALAVVFANIPTLAFAGPITFDLRAPYIESIDEVNSFSLMSGGLTSTLTALPETYLGHDVLLNQTSSSFGINVDGISCTNEQPALLDGGCTGESVGITFSSDVYLNSLKVSSFGLSSTLGMDQGLVTIAGSLFAMPILTTGLLSLDNTFLAAGSSLNIAYLGGNGFSLDNFTVSPTSVDEGGATLLLLGVGIIGVCLARRKHNLIA